MTSSSDTAIQTALQYGAALLKFVSPNDCGLTKSHQRGFYLPKKAWEIFTTKPPKPGENYEEAIRIEWQDGRVTDSKIKWYGRAKNEFRLTSFGREREFPFLREDRVGSLLVFIPSKTGEARCFMLDAEEDMENVQAALGVDASITGWGVFDSTGNIPSTEPQSGSLESILEGYVAHAESFPSTSEVSTATLAALQRYSPNHILSGDKLLERAIKTEFRLFKLLESKFVSSSIRDGFSDVESFLTVAQTVLQRRKSRAGRSLEFHVEEVLRKYNIPFQSQALLDGTRPDLVIPHTQAYLEATLTNQQVVILALKTTCKDRWRQILQEAPRVTKKYLLTLQPGISGNQMDQMTSENVQLVVPLYLHDQYEPSRRQHLMTVEDFLNHIRGIIPRSQDEAQVVL